MVQIVDPSYRFVQSHLNYKYHLELQVSVSGQTTQLITYRLHILKNYAQNQKMHRPVMIHVPYMNTVFVIIIIILAKNIDQGNNYYNMLS